MRLSGRLVLGVVSGLLTSGAIQAGAQQGSVQLSTSVQGVTGDSQRLAGQNRFEPDVGISWLQPGSRFGIFQIELRGARRGDSLHTGRIYGSLRDLKYGGIVWTIEAGDAYFAPALGEYRFTNLFTPAVTFNGATVTGRTEQSSVFVLAGKTTAWRNIFGNDPQALGQSLAVARVTHRPTARLEVTARGSRVRTSSLREFSYTIDASDQIGAGAKLAVTSSFQLVADGSLVSYRRSGVAMRERDSSYMAGANWLHSRGWLQLNASRFSPGEFPSLNNPLQDRQGVFAAGEYDVFPRARVSAGWETFRSNLEPEQSLASTRPTPESSGSRGFGGVRVQVTPRSALTFRGERGGRDSRPIGFGFPSDSDTGAWSGEWQAAIRQTNAFVRYSARRNVERLNHSGSYDQRDASAQLFANVTRTSQVFGTAMLTRTEVGLGEGSTYWQAGGGTQIRVPNHDLWLRAEGNAARSMDLLTRNFVPRESLGFGLNGQLSRRTTVALNINLDRSPSPSLSGSPWISRSILRVTRALPTGSVRVADGVRVSESVARRGTGTVSGSVFADWNANGVADQGENSLEGIPLRLGSGHSTTGRDGQFAFLSVPVGVLEVALDTSALPVDFDPPPVTAVQLQLSRGDSKHVAFGLIPLGAIHGRVIRDVNGNGKADPNEEPIEGAIVILDGGARSEQARRGRYRFDSVRSGSHLVKLLVESLPEGARIAGDAEVPAELTREALTKEISFVVAIEKHPEIRKAFPPRGGGAATTAGVRTQPRIASARPSAASPGVRTGPATAEPIGSGTKSSTYVSAPRGTAAGVKPPPRAGSTAPPDRASDSPAFAVQVAALSDPLRARDVVNELKATGMPAYLVSPPAADPDAPYRVRLGPYSTRTAAQEIASAMEKKRGEKLWVTKEP